MSRMHSIVVAPDATEDDIVVWDRHGYKELPSYWLAQLQRIVKDLGKIPDAVVHTQDLEALVIQIQQFLNSVPENAREQVQEYAEKAKHIQQENPEAFKRGVLSDQIPEELVESRYNAKHRI